MIFGYLPFLSLSWKSDRTCPTLREQGRPGVRGVIGVKTPIYT